MPAKQSGGVEHFLSDEGLGHAGDRFLSLFEVEPAEKIVDGIAVGNGIDTEQDLELLTRRTVVSKQVS